MKKHFLFLCLSILGSLTAYAQKQGTYEKIEDEANLPILSPLLSQRQTAKIRLSNGLEAYLISDPGIEQSAAALAVQVGSWSDPEKYPGMAHFLEHMLFMGTAAYPKEFEYMQYIGDHGGKVNAYTASDRTVYIFSVNNDGFEGALDRFSHFFIDPLFLPSSINRELHAVDQEHAKNVEHDGWRQYMIYKETGNQNHPNAKFSTGNAKTLGGIPQEAMIQWYNTNYSADRMHLVVLSNRPIDELIQMTVQDFSAVKAHPTARASFGGSMTSEQQKGKWIYIKPVKDLKLLSLTWEIPNQLAKDQESKAGELLAYILKSGSSNSLLSLLKKNHLAEAISVSQEQFAPSNKLFSIDIELTDQGIDEIDRVVTYCFEEIARLKKEKLPSYIFDEYQRMEEIKYEYQTRTEAYLFVQQNAHKLVDEAIETYPRKTLLVSQYNQEMISAYLDVLSPENCIYFVLADPSKTGIAPTEKEKWMGAEYTVRSIDQKKLISWANATPNPQIGLPPPNPFIPENLHLVYNRISDKQEEPTLLQEDDYAKIFYSDDQRYLSPEVAHLFRIKTPALDGSARSKVMADIYLKAVDDKLFSLLHAAETAGYRVAFREENLGLILSINGYSDKASSLAEDLFAGIQHVRPSKEQFALYKSSLAATYDNAAKELPLLQSFELLGSILFNNSPTSVEKRQALETITYEEFLIFTHSLYQKAYVEGLLYGNLEKEEAKTLWSHISKKFHPHGYPLVEQKSREILILPENKGPYMVSQTTPMLGNAALLVIEQGPYSFEKRASQEVLARVLKDGFFDTLRTKQQIAYIAKAWEREEERQLLQFFAVQSSTHKPQELIARFELFLEDFIKQFTTKFPKERFKKVQKMAINSLQMPPENLSIMGTRLFLLGFNYGADFNLVNKRIAALKNLTYEEAHAAAKETLSRKNTRRIAILTEGITQEDNHYQYLEVSREDLREQGTFVAWKNDL